MRNTLNIYNNLKRWLLISLRNCVFKIKMSTTLKTSYMLEMRVNAYGASLGNLSTLICKFLKILFPFILYFWTIFTEQVTCNNSKWFLHDSVSFSIWSPINILSPLIFMGINSTKEPFKRISLSSEFWIHKGLSAYPEKTTKNEPKSRVMTKVLSLGNFLPFHENFQPVPIHNVFR
jgi:hypothetical protein